LIADNVIKGDEERDQILNASLPESAKYEALLALEDAIKMLCIDLLQLSGSLLSFKLIEKLSPLFSTIRAESTKAARASYWSKKGFSDKLARSIQSYAALANGSEVFMFSEKASVAVERALTLINQIDTALNLNSLRDLILGLPSQSPWDVAHHYLMLQDLRSAKFSLLLNYLKQKSKKGTGSADFKSALMEVGGPSLQAFEQAFLQLQNSSTVSASLLTVLIKRLTI